MCVCALQANERVHMRPIALTILKSCTNIYLSIFPSAASKPPRLHSARQERRPTFALTPLLLVPLKWRSLFDPPFGLSRKLPSALTTVMSKLDMGARSCLWQFVALLHRIGPLCRAITTEAQRAEWSCSSPAAQSLQWR